jgi:large repetitive protein
MQVKSSQLSQERALVKPHSGCTSISIHAGPARRANELIRPVLLFLLAVGVVLMAPAALWSQTVSFAGVQSTVSSELYDPFNVAVDGAGNAFIADTYNNRVVKVTRDGTQTTVAGGLNLPQGVAVDAAGDVFIADSGNNKVLKLPAAGGAPSEVGSGLNLPKSVAVDRAGAVFIADQGNSRVVEVPAGGGAQTTLGSGLLSPAGVAVGGAGDVFIADTGNNRVVEVPATGGAQTMLGSGLFHPYGVAVDGAGDVFIADSDNNRVVMVPAGGGAQTTLGSGLLFPAGVAVDGAGDVFIADINNSRVVEVSFARNAGTVNVCPSGQASPAPCTQTLTLNYNITESGTFGSAPTVVTQGAPNLDFTLAGGSTCTGDVAAGSSCAVNVTFAPRAPGMRMGAVELADASGNLLATTLVYGDGQGPAVAFDPGVQSTVRSGLSEPQGVAVDGAGDVFIVDTFNSKVVKVPAGGGVQTAVGSGLNYPRGVAVDGAGDVFISDTLNNRVVEVPAGGGAQTEVGSGLSYPFGVAVDGAGDVFIADYGNGRIIKLPAGGGAQMVVSSGLNLPCAVAVDGAGDIFIADTLNSRVVNVQRSQPPVLSFAATPMGSTSSDSPQSVTVENSGNAILSLSGVTVGSNFAQVAGSGTPADCTSSSSLAPGENCNLSLSFTPVARGPITGAATLTDNSMNGNPATQPIGLTGTGSLQTQTITFNPISTQVVGTRLSLSASADSNLTVSFASQTPAVCTVSGTTATFATAGTCTIEASQSGNTSYAAATPVSQSFSVNLQTQTITFNPILTQVLGTPLSLSASASSGLTVSFASLTTAVCRVSGTTATLVTAGTCTIQASQSGNASYAAATSVSQSFSVTDFSLTVSPSSQTISPGKTAVYSAALMTVNGFSGTVTLGCTGAPPKSTCSVSPASVALTGSSSAKISAAIKTRGTFGLTITARSGADVHTATASITVK